MKGKVISFIRSNLSKLIIVALVVTIGFLLMANKNLEFSLIDYQAIPHIDLNNTLSYSGASNSFEGEARGFIVFANKKDQPKNMRQYYIIESTKNRDEQNNQIFFLEDFLVLPSLPPTSLGKTVLLEKSRSGEAVALEDENGNQFYLDTNSKEISMKDATGDITRLITSNSEYKEFMWKFLKNQK